jgi:hypothetical protein
MSAKSVTTVGFRLTAEQHAALAAAADEDSLSVHECARRLVVNGLAQPAPNPALQAEIAALRGDVAVTLEACLLLVGMPADQAKKFIKEKLHR